MGDVIASAFALTIAVTLVLIQREIRLMKMKRRAQSEDASRKRGE
ncbi:hypothetical protein [Nitrobacter sp. TKz-YC02]